MEHSRQTCCTWVMGGDVLMGLLGEFQDSHVGSEHRSVTVGMSGTLG